MPSRLNDPKRSAIAVVMQRLRDEDISGPYVHVMLPMEFEPERACATPRFSKTERLRQNLRRA